MQATIKSISLCYSHTLTKGIRISVQCEDKKYASSWIGENAPEWVSEQWWKLIGIQNNWYGFASEEGFRLLQLEIEIDCEESEYGRNIKKLKGLCNSPAVASEPEKITQTTQATQSNLSNQIQDDDIPF